MIGGSIGVDKFKNAKILSTYLPFYFASHFGLQLMLGLFATFDFCQGRSKVLKTLAFKVNN